jgi:hypothetical protein
MGLRWTEWPSPVLAALRRGVVIPAHPAEIDRVCAADPHRAADACVRDNLARWLP